VLDLAKRVGRHLLPWTVSGGAIFYVFRFAIDWQAIPAATEGANLPLFIAITSFDKVAFFLVWAFVQSEVIRRFIQPVPTRKILAMKGAAELLRTASNVLSDGAFMFGVSRLISAPLAAVLVAITIPFGVHFGVLLLQATLVLPLLDGGIEGNLDVAGTALIGWLIVAAIVLAGRYGFWRRALSRINFGIAGQGIGFRQLRPFFAWFMLFGVFDVFIQGSASRAFGVDIAWVSLAARLPVLYLALSIPSFGNFGTREIAWSNLFADYGSREELIAFALWTNAIFAALHFIIGALFFPRAIRMLRDFRQAKKEGESVPQPFLRDAIDP
jgi:hypothetical protein